jgi:hypothetical protein
VQIFTTDNFPSDSQSPVPMPKTFAILSNVPAILALFSEIRRRGLILDLGQKAALGDDRKPIESWINQKKINLP